MAFGSNAEIGETAMPKTHELLQVLRPSGLGNRGGGVALVYSWALTGTRSIEEKLHHLNSKVESTTTSNTYLILNTIENLKFLKLS